jgi:deoxyadenosine/deoxycytidine kinase
MCAKSTALTTKERLRQILKRENIPILSSADHVFTIAVEGNIAAGKTTFLNHFRDIPEIDVYDEPVSKWRNVNGLNLLRLMYDNPIRNSHAFQSYVMLTMLEQHSHKSKKMVKVMERSIFSARHCFMKHMLSATMMQICDYEVLCSWFEYLTNDSHINTKVDLVIYLQTDPKTAFERLIKRNRFEEDSVRFSYIRDIHQRHEDWLIGDSAAIIPVPVLVLNANVDVSNYKAECDTILSEVVAYLSSE